MSSNRQYLHAQTRQRSVCTRRGPCAKLRYPQPASAGAVVVHILFGEQGSSVRATETGREKKVVKDSDVSNVYIYEGGKTTSPSLLDRVRTRDKSAWERMVHLYAPLVDYWLWKAGLQRADRDDLRQEVFLAVDRKIE